MAGIDKLRTRNYSDYIDLRFWCLLNAPHLLMNIYEFSDVEFARLQKRQSKNTDYGDDANIVIAHFSCNEDKFLYWHCPLDFIREYLETQCGYKKANWFVKLFWKY